MSFNSASLSFKYQYSLQYSESHLHRSQVSPPTTSHKNPSSTRKLAQHSNPHGPSLSTVRDYTIRGELDRIVWFNDEFRFGSDYSFPCSAEIGYRSKQGNLYTLEALLFFFINNNHLKHIEYLQKARTQGIPAVTLLDRKPLVEYLQGKVSFLRHRPIII
ncbi:protein CDC73 homolog [Fagus crenata]